MDAVDAGVVGIPEAAKEKEEGYPPRKHESVDGQRQYKDRMLSLSTSAT